MEPRQPKVAALSRAAGRIATGLAAILAAIATGATAGCASSQSKVDATAPLTLARQGSFFMGGRDVKSDSLSTLAAYPTSGTITVDQVYVRYQVPAAVKGTPIVLIHGCCLTGKTWETTPDGRIGWDEYFVRRGHPVYVVDQAWRGRSAANIAAINTVKSGKAGVDQLPTAFAAGHEGAWAIFRFGPAYPETFPGLRFPLDAQAEFWKQMVPDWLNSLPTPNPTVAALGALARRLRSAVLISHSQSGIYPFQAAQVDSTGIAAIVSIEPGACPASGSDLSPYTRMPVMVLFGDYIDQSTRWAPRLKTCREFVAAANKAGGKAELLLLPEIGINGNSHMLMQDSNSLEIADLMVAWLARQVRP
jgi:pimeloyl-ACP methyl ester carboxylesterase